LELVIVDGGSTDRSVELIENYASQVGDDSFRILLVKEGNAPRGPAYARNLGIRKAQGASVLLADANVILEDENIIAALHEALKSSNVAGFRSKVPIDTWLEFNLMLDEGDPRCLQPACVSTVFCIAR
jgi:glycosyltransferase involved in cell wall biosynthesis